MMQGPAEDAPIAVQPLPSQPCTLHASSFLTGCLALAMIVVMMFDQLVSLCILVLV